MPPTHLQQLGSNGCGPTAENWPHGPQQRWKCICLRHRGGYLTSDLRSEVVGYYWKWCLRLFCSVFHWMIATSEHHWGSFFRTFPFGWFERWTFQPKMELTDPPKVWQLDFVFLPNFSCLLSLQFFSIKSRNRNIDSWDSNLGCICYRYVWRVYLAIHEPVPLGWKKMGCALSSPVELIRVQRQWSSHPISS